MYFAHRAKYETVQVSLPGVALRVVTYNRDIGCVGHKMRRLTQHVGEHGYTLSNRSRHNRGRRNGKDVLEKPCVVARRWQIVHSKLGRPNEGILNALAYTIFTADGVVPICKCPAK